MSDLDFERLLNRKEASAFLSERGYKVAVATLNKLACVGGGPPFRKFGRRPLYRPTDLIAWVAARTTTLVRSTSEVDSLLKQRTQPEAPTGGLNPQTRTGSTADADDGRTNGQPAAPSDDDGAYASQLA